MKIKIKENDLKTIIKDIITECLNVPAWINPWNDIKEYPLTEGLTCTYNIGKVLGILKRKFSKEINDKIFTVGNSFDYNMKSKDKLKDVISTNNNFKTTQDTDNWIVIIITFSKGIRDNKNLPNEISKICEACGWFFTHFLYYKRDTETYELKPIVTKTIDYNNEWLMEQPIQMFFRAKFNAEYKEKSVPNFLFHIAPVRVLDKIKKQGLTPRANGRQEMHPERVYCYIEKPRNWHEIANNFRKSNIDEPYALLIIDTRKINPKIKFYYVSNTYSDYPTAIYTNETIPPYAIKVLNDESDEQL